MPLSWNEIKDRALRFSREWLHAGRPDPLSMPTALVKAHQALDRTVDDVCVAAEKAAGSRPPKLGSEAERMTFLFERYQHLTSLLPATKPKATRRRRAVAGLATTTDGDFSC